MFVSNTMKWFLVGLAIMFVAACGGGGGGSVSNSEGNIPQPIKSGVPVAAVFKPCSTDDYYSVNIEKGYAVKGSYYFFLPEDISTFQCSQSPSFARDANNLYVGVTQIPFSNFSALKFVGTKYANDGSKVYGVEGADAATFELINPEISQNYSQDKSHVFYKGRYLSGADRDTFTLLGDDTALDNDQIFLGSSREYLYVDGNVSSLRGVEALGGKYFKDENDVLYYLYLSTGVSNQVGFNVISGIDAASFEYISGDYAKDKDSYYYFRDIVAPISDGELIVRGGDFITIGDKMYRGRRAIADVDMSSLVFLPEYNFAYDANRMYGQPVGFNSGIVIVADTSGFQIMEGGFVQTDTIITSLNLAFQGDPAQMNYLGGGFMSGPEGIYSPRGLLGVDSDSFEFVGIMYRYDSPQVFYKDVNSVERYYFSDKPDPATYQILGRNYARDATRIYYGTTLIRNADVDTFQIINSVWSKDATRIYYKQYSTAILDVDAFVMIDDDYAHDGVNYIYQGSAIGAYQPNTLELLGLGYSRIGNEIYYRDTLVADVDAASFSVLTNYFLGGYPLTADINNLYWGPTSYPGYSVDLDTLKRIDDRFFGDNQNIFTSNSRVSDALSFSFFGRDYFRNVDSVFYFPVFGANTPQLLSSADPEQFSVMAGDYYGDVDDVFYKGVLLTGLDAGTTLIELDLLGVARDLDVLYYLGNLVDIDVSTFEKLQYGESNLTSQIYFGGAAGVYCRENLLDMADRATFVIGNDPLRASDASYTYAVCNATLK